MVCPPPCPPPPLVPGCTSDYSSGDAKLRKIADDLREIMPLNAILPTEQITFPSVGEVVLGFIFFIVYFISARKCGIEIIYFTIFETLLLCSVRNYMILRIVDYFCVKDYEKN